MNKIIYFVASSLLLSPQLSQADDVTPAQAKEPLIKSWMNSLSPDLIRGSLKMRSNYSNNFMIYRSIMIDVCSVSKNG